MEPRLKGLSNEEAAEVAIKILAQVLAKHIHVANDGPEYYKKLMKRIYEAAFDYSQKHAHELALASVLTEHDAQKGVSDTIIK